MYLISWEIFCTLEKGTSVVHSNLSSSVFFQIWCISDNCYFLINTNDDLFFRNKNIFREKYVQKKQQWTNFTFDLH